MDEKTFIPLENLHLPAQQKTQTLTSNAQLNTFESFTRSSANADVSLLPDTEFFENRGKREWLSTKEAAHFLSISENALRILVHHDQVPTFKFGSRLRFRLRDCQALFKRKGA